MAHDEQQLPAAVSGHADPSGEAPWAMQIVVRVEKTDPPSHTAVVVAAAKAVVALLDDDRATCGEWAASVDRWTEGRIRKHTRRARGSHWTAVQQLPGVTIEYEGAQVRALVPCPTDAVWREVARLQLSGLDLADDTTPSAPVAGLVVAVTPSPKLSTGKAAAAAGHAVQVARLHADVSGYEAWVESGYPISVRFPTVDEWDRLVEDAPVRIVDAGFTDVDPGTTTAVAFWQ